MIFKVFVNAAQKELTMRNFRNIVKHGKTKGGYLVPKYLVNALHYSIS